MSSLLLTPHIPRHLMRQIASAVLLLACAELSFVKSASGQTTGTETSSARSPSVQSLGDAVVLAQLLSQHSSSSFRRGLQAAGSRDVNTTIVASVTADWAAKYFPTDSAIQITARSLVRRYSGEDLRALIVFFQSPLGARYLERQPEVTSDVMLETTRLLQPHQEELQQSIVEQIRARAHQ